MYMEGFLNQGWDSILPGCGRTSPLSREATAAATWIYDPQPISDQPIGGGLLHRARPYRPGRSPFSSLGC